MMLIGLALSVIVLNFDNGGRTVKSVQRVTRKDLLEWLGTSNDMTLKESLLELILEVINEDYNLKMLQKDIHLYRGAF